jgi:hypothetical protein
MTDEQSSDNQSSDNGEELPVPWKQVQSAVWLIGLAILFWQGWLWPGILVLVAISGLVQAGLQLYVSRRQEQAVIETQRAAHLPQTCPNCGGPLDASTVRWTSANAAVCPYCNASVKATEPV